VNKCEEDGREWRAELAAKIKSAELGANARLEYARRGSEAVASSTAAIAEREAKVAEVSRY
jgi:hypothetical protein